MSRRTSKNKAKHISSPELTDDEIPVTEEPKPHSIRPQKKRCYNSIAESGGGDCISSGPSNSTNFGNDIQSMLNNIGTDFGKSRHAKRQRLEQYTTGAMKINETKYAEMRQNQEAERRKLHDELERNVSSVLEEWDVDISRLKDQEEKISKIIQQQMKMIQQNRNVAVQKLATLRQTHEQYHKNYTMLERRHSEQCNNTQVEIRKELDELQQQFMLEMQKEEMTQMQKYFQSMLLM